MDPVANPPVVVQPTNAAALPPAQSRSRVDSIYVIGGLLLIGALVALVVMLTRGSDDAVVASSTVVANATTTSNQVAAGDSQVAGTKVSKLGFKYVENSLSFVNPSIDKPVALKQIKGFLNESEIPYSEEQLNAVPDYVVIMILEAEEEDYGLKTGLITMLIRSLHPEYKKAVELMAKAYGGTDDHEVLYANVVNKQVLSTMDVDVLNRVLNSIPTYITPKDAMHTCLLFRDRTIYSLDELKRNETYIRTVGNQHLNKLREAAGAI